MTEKEIIFFDGDGTIWYPQKTKRDNSPHWIYDDPETKVEYLNHLSLVPKLKPTLETLRDRGYQLILISTHPHERQEKADQVLKEKVTHFRLESYFDSFHTAPPYARGKGEIIEKVLKVRGITKDKALLVGDNYVFDYLSARRVGVDGLLIDSAPLREYLNKKKIKVRETISETHEILEYLP